MKLNIDTLRQQIPYYLTNRKELLEGLKAIASGGKDDYFMSPYNDSFKNQMLQGDGWRGFQLFDFDTGERISVRGLVLSNTCDIDPKNSRETPTLVTFVPLLELADYMSILRENGIKQQRIKHKIDSIKAQKVNNILYLPADGPLKEEYIVPFDNIHSMPITAHHNAHDKEKLFTLSDVGFYMLVFKLSIHFCRLQEGIQRKS